jgi:hypothetical protein
MMAAKLDHLVSSSLGRERPLRTTVPGTALAPYWCPPGLTLSQRRRIKWMRAQKMREEVVEKERDEHFNTIRLVIPMKQEWRVKENAITPALINS